MTETGPGLGPRTLDSEATRVRAELAVAAAGIGTFDWDLTTGVLVWDDQLHELFGYRPGDFDRTIEEFFRRVHPDDAPGVQHALDGAVAQCGDYEADYRIVRPDGVVRWVAARGRALGGPDGIAVRVIGVAFDTTAVRDSDARVARVLETMPTAFCSLDEDWCFSYVNAEAERLLGRRREELIGGVVWDLFPAARDSVFEEQYRRAVADGVPVTFDAYYPAPLNGWYELRAWPGPDGLAVYFHDIQERRAAQQELERLAARSALLADVAAELAGTLEAQDAVARLARLVVPILGEWCIVTLIDQSSTGPVWHRLQDVGWWHADPQMRPAVREYARLRISGLDESSLMAATLRGGQTMVVRGGATERICQALTDPDAEALLRRLAPQDAIVLPLVASGRLLGALTLYDGSGGRRYGPGTDGALAGAPDDDLHAALDIAARAGLALENARLYEQQRRVAEGLQRSLLTEPPRIDGLQVAVRYQPAAEAARVGGDWYDAFRVRDGVITLVIGDVAGHDTAAAAAMGQARALLRGIAATTGEGPAAVLTRLDTVLQTLEVDLVATVLVAELERSAEQEGVGGARLRWSSAGHPAPLVLTTDGTVLDLTDADGARPDLLLGVDRSYVRAEHEVQLEAGSTLLLFTDGLVERRGEPYSVGLRRVREVLADLATLELEGLCDALLDRVLPDRPGDDVALAAVRFRAGASLGWSIETPG